MDTVINVRTNKKVRDKAQKVFSSMGISTSAGVNIFLHQVAVEKGLPFTPTTDTKKIRKRWDAEVEEALRTGKRYTNAKDLLRDL